MNQSINQKRQMTQGKKVLVAMSGGVDSSVAAALLREQGYQVVGCFMRHGSEDSVEELDADDAMACDATKKKAGHQGCCSLNDAVDARLVSALLDIPFYVLNFKKDFGRIIDYFVDEYNQGRTPNPCVRCNDWLKFGKLLDYADSIDADFIATGHYAQINHDADPPQLLRGKDTHKDQSYVLFGATKQRLKRMLLPIGGLEKSEVRKMAESWNLPVFDKPDSQEICFVPDNNYGNLVKKQTPDQVSPGQVLNQEGTVVGEHQGHQNFTIGQRRGVGVALGYPIYVVERDAKQNTITVGTKDDLYAAGLLASELNWLIEPPIQAIDCQVKIRYNGGMVAARVKQVGDDQLAVHFHEPMTAVTPGQAVVCYLGDQCLGGGWIDSALPCEK